MQSSGGGRGHGAGAPFRSARGLPRSCLFSEPVTPNPTACVSPDRLPTKSSMAKSARVLLMASPVSGWQGHVSLKHKPCTCSSICGRRAGSEHVPHPVPSSPTAWGCGLWRSKGAQGMDHPPPPAIPATKASKGRGHGAMESRTHGSGSRARGTGQGRGRAGTLAPVLAAPPAALRGVWWPWGGHPRSLTRPTLRGTSPIVKFSLTFEQDAPYLHILGSKIHGTSPG